MDPLGAWAPAGRETEALQAKDVVCQGRACALDARWRGGHRLSPARAEVHIRDARPGVDTASVSTDAWPVFSALVRRH